LGRRVIARKECQREPSKPARRLVDRADDQGLDAVALPRRRWYTVNRDRRCVAPVVRHLKSSSPSTNGVTPRPSNSGGGSVNDTNAPPGTGGLAETYAVTLVWAVLDLLITHRTNGIHCTALDRQGLKRARYERNAQPLPEEVTAA
jgi:hypothetical protein